MALLTTAIETATVRETKAEAQRRQRAIAAATRRRQRDAELEVIRIKGEITYFTKRYTDSLNEKLAYLDPAKLIEADPYAEALISQSDVELPQIDKMVADKIHSIFAYGILLAGERLPVNVFAGQRAHWFPAALNAAWESQNRKVPNAPIKAPEKEAKLVIRKPVANFDTTPVERAVEDAPKAPEVELAPAITMPRKARSQRTRSKKGSKKAKTERTLVDA
ncbi:MAG TPA: hypothetical protein VF597_04280 [Candidatus Saccharimonadales bacterium]|jgi:hypothetical protein